MRVEHIAIWTRNLDALKSFYETYFEAVSSRMYTNPGKGFASYFLSFASGARIELMCMEGIPPTRNDPVAQFTGLIHIAFSTGSKEAVDALTHRLESAGYRVAGQPRWTGDGYYESAVLDPDGNRIEITI